MISIIRSNRNVKTAAAAAAATATAAAAAAVPKKIEETPWLVEMKNILFYFGINEIYGKSEAVKNSSTKNHVWYKWRTIVH